MHVVRQEPLPINPFIPQEFDSGGIVIRENANTVAATAIKFTGLPYSLKIFGLIGCFSSQAQRGLKVSW